MTLLANASNTGMIQCQEQVRKESLRKGKSHVDVSASVQKSAGCAFTEVIAVILAQLEENGVSRFECPTCLAIREIKPKGDRVKFPAHPKRLTTTPNQGSRWVKRAAAWKLFDA